jgi:hypothetical protein
VKRATAVALFAIVLVAGSASAQERPAAQPRRGPPVIKIAKWGLLGVAGGLGLYALRHSTRAEDSYDDLRSICLATPARCDHGNRRYADDEAERLYRAAIAEDRRAQLGIFGGQATLFGSVGLFIYDLRDDRTPTTIPYPGRGGSANFVLATVIF